MTDVFNINYSNLFGGERTARPNRMLRAAQKQETLTLPASYQEIPEEEMYYEGGGGAFPVAAISIPINLLLCLNPYVGLGFAGVMGMAKFGFKKAAKAALKPILKGILSALSFAVGAIYAGAAAAIRGVTNDQIDQVVTIAFNCFGGLGSIIAMVPDMVDGKMDGWCRW